MSVEHEHPHENGNPNENGNLNGDTDRHSPFPDGQASSDNLVAISSRASVFKKRNFYRNLSIGLTVVVILLLIAFIVSLCEYIVQWNKTRNIQKVCKTEDCLRSAANLKLSMDTSVNPCNDFYKFTCGRWTKEHPNHGWYPHFSSFETIEERVSLAALDFFKSNESSDEPIPVRQSRYLYRSCMDTDALDTLGYTVLLKYLKKVDLPLLPSFFDATRDSNFTFDWINLEVKLKKTFAMDTFIGFLVDAEIYNRSNSVIYMGTPGTSCPLPSPLKSKRSHRSATQRNPEPEEKAKEEAYKRIVKSVIGALALNVSGKVPEDGVMEEAASAIWNMTKDVEQLVDTNSTSYDIQFYKMKVDELQNLTDQFLSQNGQPSTPLWRRYLTLLFEGVIVPNISLNLDDTDFVYVPVEELHYFPELALYLTTVPNVVLELFMWWTAVFSLILSTTSEMTDYIAKESEPFSNSGVYRSRSLDCAGLVMNFMGLAISYGVADKTLLNNTKPKVEHMLNGIKEAFVERVADLNWMDRETKKATLEKTKGMISFIGFPEWLLNKTALESYYSGLNIKNDTFLDNMMSMVENVTYSQLITLRQESERTWRTDPTTVNAYNYFSDNSITVPMTILTHPFYSLGLEALNYGAIGTVLGHELTHGFDNIGRKFDKYGNYKQWWSNQTIEAFENKTQCFVDQYGNFSIPPIETKINGKLTLGENLADNGGLHHAFLAYKNYIKKYGEEPKLPGFESYSNIQMFFIAYGSIWCETPNLEAVKIQIENDEHCPSPLRVLGTLINSFEFAEAFKCPTGSKMNPSKLRCRIW